MTNPDAPESLEAACPGFAKFLRQVGYPELILWVAPDDVVWNGKKLWVRSRTAVEIQEAAAQRYRESKRQGYGICLYAFSTVTHWTIATILVSTNRDEAERHMMPLDVLKMSAVEEKLSAASIATHTTWILRSMLHREISRQFRKQFFSIE